MRQDGFRHVVRVCCFSLFTVAACSSSSSNTDAAGTGGNGGASGTGTDTSAFISIAPCTDMSSYATGATTVMTTADFKYSPACLKVPLGTSVTIQASSVHPLSGLTTGSANNPIPSGGKMSDQTVTFATAGFYPFQCDVHFSIGMTGVVWAE